VRAIGLLHAPDGGDPAEQAVRVRVLITLSSVETELRGRDEGLARLREAEQLAAAAGDPALEFAVESALGLQLLRRGDHAAALDHFAAAERVVRHAEASEACTLYLNRGNLMLPWPGTTWAISSSWRETCRRRCG
jgi:hypothetical protein